MHNKEEKNHTSQNVFNKIREQKLTFYFERQINNRIDLKKKQTLFMHASLLQYYVFSFLTHIGGIQYISALKQFCQVQRKNV